MPGLGTVPHFPDCDDDGWGDPYELVPNADGILIQTSLQECAEVDPDIADGDCPLVENDLDCDDTYADSGADYTGSGCPNKQIIPSVGPIQPSDYVTGNDGIREFLVFLPEVRAKVATKICNDWSQGIRVDGLDTSGVSGGVATLDTPAQRQTAEDTVNVVGEQVLWVDGTFATGGTTSLVWDLPVAEGEAQLPIELPYCDGGTSLDELDIGLIPVGLPEAADVEARELEAMLVAVRFGSQQLCVERTDPDCAGYDEVDPLPTGSCKKRGVLCERPYIRDTEFFEFRDAGEAICGIVEPEE